ncbi:UNVERIFIED_CONTAM: hypothetical protein Slati_4505300 [Sesamum latifolium]|uniref:Retrotransposon gag domain-containing protein n=1 Tax=Sesamum latifolium TaxID=2727402 RepID=A0AAW2SS67_9LAMI
MANSNNEGDQGSYGGNSSLPATSDPAVSPVDPVLGDIGIPGPDPTPRVYISALVPAPDQTVGPAVLNPLLCEQLQHFIMDTVNSALRGSQASGVSASSQVERGGTPASRGVDEQVPARLQQDRSLPVDFGVKKTVGHQPPDIWRSLKKEMVELREQVTRETLFTERGVPFSEQIMIEELLIHFRAPAHLPANDGSTDLVEHIRKFENAALLNRSRKYKKSTISLFGIKQEEKKTLRAYVQRFNTTVLEVPTPHQEVLASAFTQGLRGGPLFESLAKRPAVDFLDVLARTEKYMNLEDAWLVKNNEKDRKKENESVAPRRARGDSQGRFNPLDPKNDQYTPLITSPARILMAIDRLPALQWPKGAEEGPLLPKSKYFCRYHREYGHDTNHYRQLRQERERLIQAGYLKDYVDKEKK